MALPKKEEESLQTLYATDIPKGTLCAGASSGRESPKVFGIGESTTPILTSGGHRGDPPTNQDLKAESRIKSTLPDDTYKASGLPTEDPHSTSTLPASTGIGTHAAANPTMWLFQSNSLLINARTHRGGP